MVNLVHWPSIVAINYEKLMWGSLYSNNITNLKPHWIYAIHGTAEVLKDMLTKQPGVYEQEGGIYYRLTKFHGPLISIVKKMIHGSERFVPTRITEIPSTLDRLSRKTRLNEFLDFSNIHGSLFPRYLADKFTLEEYKDPQAGWKPGWGDVNSGMARFANFEFNDWDKLLVLSKAFANYRIEAAAITIGIKWGQKEFMVTVDELISWLLEENTNRISPFALDFFNYLTNRYKIFESHQIELGAESDLYPLELYPYNEIEINAFGLSGTFAHVYEFRNKYEDLGKDWAISLITLPYCLGKYIRSEFFVLRIDQVNDLDRLDEIREDESRKQTPANKQVVPAHLRPKAIPKVRPPDL